MTLRMAVLGAATAIAMISSATTSANAAFSGMDGTHQARAYPIIPANAPGDDNPAQLCAGNFTNDVALLVKDLKRVPTDAEKKGLAVSCAIFHLTAYELTGSTTSLDAVMYYADKGNLTVQDIDDKRWPSAEGSTFVADMKRVSTRLAGLTMDERRDRLATWAQMFVDKQREWRNRGYQPTRQDLLTLGGAAKSRFNLGD